MKNGLFFVIVFLSAIGSRAQYSLTLAAYSQDFNGLGTGNSTVAGGDLNLVNSSLNGWYFSESGTNADFTITAGDGSSNTGDTYNFGSTAAADRTLGGLQSGTLIPTFGFYFTNNTGSTITSLLISYTGEQWRLGATGRTDKINFQYSMNASSLSNGTWVDVSALSFTAPVSSGSVGALDGNAAGNRTAISNTLLGLNIPNGSSCFIRWSDFDATGSDDGLGIDDFSLLAGLIPPSTDYFRSAASGSWDNLSTWESSPDNIVWAPATSIPNSSANTITIRNGHTVSFAAFLSVDQVVIASGGTLDFTNGVLTVEDNIAGDDIDVQSGGVFVLSLASTPPGFGTGSPTVNINGGGVLRVSASGLTSPAGTGVHLSNFVYQHQSILEYTLNGAFGTDNVTYFPNVNATTIPIFRVTNSSNLLVGANNPTTFKGIFEANGTGGVTWQNSGDKIFRNGIRGTDNMSANGSAASAKFMINGLTGELGGTGGLTVPTTGGLQIGSSTTVTLISDKTVTGNITLLTSNSLVVLGAYNLTVTGTIGITQVSSYIKTDGTGKLILNSVGSGASGKLFPVGRSTINPLFISSPTTATYGARIVEPVTPPIYNSAWAVLRTWYLTCSVAAPASTISFGYSYPGDCGGSFVNTGANAEAGVYIASSWNIHQHNLTPSAFPLVPGTFIVTPTLPISYFNGSGTEFPFVISNNGAILPLDYFIVARARKVNNNGIIRWNVFNTDDARGFEVQHSINNSGFHTIGTVNIQSNLLDYSYVDANLERGTHLYRIKVNRNNGNTSYSNTVALISDTKGLMLTSISPDPVRATAEMIISTGRGAAVHFEVYDITGKKVKRWISYVAEGNTTIHADLRELPAGLYHILAYTPDAQTVSRFVKQ